MPDISLSRRAIKEEGLAAWLLCNVFHRDEIADSVLGIPPESMNTRPWVCVLFADRPPAKIVHRVESSILDRVPGSTVSYYTRDEYTRALSETLPRGGRVGAQFSTAIPVGSFLDHGTALLVEGLGVSLVPSESLVARFLGVIDEGGARSHETAGAVLHEAILDVWEWLRAEIRRGAAIRECDVRDRIQSHLSRAGLVSDGPPVVAAGPHSADPHYSLSGRGAALEPGDVLQFDVWARQDSPSAIFADISWVAVLSERPEERQRAAFEAIVRAREAAVGFLQTGLAEGRLMTGADVDAIARETLESLGFARFVRHRTGHSIGHRIHGYGVNLDSVEFPDRRPLGEGACFSIEPGVYMEDFGMRTEIDAYIRGGRLIVSGGERQRSLLLLV
jgi:Xaa-Pro aminopeptidase